MLCFLCLVIACSLTCAEIEKDWEWLQRNLSDTLNSFDSEGDITDFVCCKIQSVIANNVPDNQGIDGMSCSMISSACFMFQYSYFVTVCYLLHCFFVMAQQIVTLHEKNGGLSKYGNIISNRDAD
jgi:hypothetical protein